jgi:hypothetical protein
MHPHRVLLAQAFGRLRQFNRLTISSPAPSAAAPADDKYIGGTTGARSGFSPSSKAQSPAPKYFVDFAGAGHLAFPNLQPAAHESIVACSVAFVDDFVQDKPVSPSLTRARPGVAQLRDESKFGSSHRCMFTYRSGLHVSRSPR